MCICILSYYTYSGTEYSDDHYTILPECYYCLFSYLYPLYHPWGVFCPPLGEDTLLVHPIEVYLYNCLILGLKMQWLLIHVSNCVTFVGTACIHVWAPISTLSYYFEGFSHWWCHRNTPVMSSGMGVPSHMIISFGTDSNTLLFIWFNPYSETFFCFFPYMYWFPIGWTSKIKYFKTIVQYCLLTHRNWQ